MGSYAQSSNTSNTNYTNTPVTQSDVTNPINLINSSAKIGTTELNGSNYSSNTYVSTLDGGAISAALGLGNNSLNFSNDALSKVLEFSKTTEGRAFDFGSKLVGVVADLTKQSNSAAQANTGAALQAVALSKDETSAAADWTQNKTLIYAAVAVAIAYFWMKK